MTSSSAMFTASFSIKVQRLTTVRVRVVIIVVVGIISIVFVCFKVSARDRDVILSQHTT